ncbi:hypothetical protein RchiOBHm_Chr2g0090641 [Rosa chinensis]|uniref:Uncharacterized protein n=1 Tax=Rosa chinensis TaxID=74649 RepID=A0A2P6RJH6_ROSCH|nr:hypothetical protein RchiOBHm_Chr2g0090641 [Rosa chinensis]
MCHPAGVSSVGHRDLAVQNRRWLLLLLQARVDGARNLQEPAARGVREAAASGGGGSGGGGARRCVCSPTRHPGSFRCRQHHADQYVWGGRTVTRNRSSTN